MILLYSRSMTFDQFGIESISPSNIGKSIGILSKNTPTAALPSPALIASIPIPSGSSTSKALFMEGISSIHGGHQVAQKLTTHIFPASASASHFSPSISVRLNSGKTRSTGLRDSIANTPGAFTMKRKLATISKRFFTRSPTVLVM